MRSSAARRAPAVLIPLLLGALLTACAGTSPTAAPASRSAATSAAGATAVASSPVASSPVPSSPGPAAPQVTRLSVVLADGQVTGDSPLARVGIGRPVRLTVTSDVVDELHVHGVDEMLQLEAGEPAVLEFTPESPGRFEVELHAARRVLTRLQVR